MKRRSFIKKIIWTVVIVGLIVAFFAYQHYSNLEAKPVYDEIKIVKGSLQVNALTTGLIGPENRISIKPPIAGRIERLLVDEGDKVTKGEQLFFMSSVERAALIDAASAEGEAAVKEWAGLYQESPVVSPINGTIVKRYMQAGQSFSQGDAVFDISDRLVINAQVDETDIGKIELHQNAAISLDAYPETLFFGKVLKIAFDSTLQNNVTTYSVLVLPDSLPNFARSGMTANVTFEVKPKENLLLVPARAVKISGKKSLVLLPAKTKDLAPIEHEITTGLSDGKSIEVTSGLKENDVVLALKFELKDADETSNPFSPFGAKKGKK